MGVQLGGTSVAPCPRPKLGCFFHVVAACVRYPVAGDHVVFHLDQGIKDWYIYCFLSLSSTVLVVSEEVVGFSVQSTRGGEGRFFPYFEAMDK
eukprot:1300338-Ditylum_brightwellii.AAC.1